jgi:hypothetical protein
MRVYLAGPMTGMAKWNVAGFRSAAAYARRQSWTPVSPIDTRPQHDGPCPVGEMQTTEHGTHSYPCWFAASLAQMVTCDAVLMLPGWEDSRGAKAEWEHASRSGMTIHYLPTEREN